VGAYSVLLTCGDYTRLRYTVSARCVGEAEAEALRRHAELFGADPARVFDVRDVSTHALNAANAARGPRTVL
jgi:hypothetical protein